MTDIVERLREGVFGSAVTKTDEVLHALMAEASAEIERLRKVLEPFAAIADSFSALPDDTALAVSRGKSISVADVRAAASAIRSRSQTGGEGK